MVLSQGTSKYVNGRTGGEKGKMKFADAPLALADERQLQASVWSQLGSFRSNASNSTSRFSLRLQHLRCDFSTCFFTTEWLREA